MLKNYFKVAYRNLVRDKFFSLLNILGLTAGVAAFLLISLYVRHELSYDNFHRNGDRIYTHITQYMTAEGPINGGTFSVLGGLEFEKKIPEIEHIAQLAPVGANLIGLTDRSFYEENIYYSDKDVFEVFDFPIIKGALDLESPYKAVVTESIAKKYFGDEDPIGQLITLDKSETYEITAVAKDLPNNSYIQFNLLLSNYVLLNKVIPGSELVSNQWGKYAHTFYLLKEGVSEQVVLDKMMAVAEESFHSRLHRSEEGKLWFKARMMPFQDIHLESGFKRGMSATSDMKYIYLFSAIAALILIIACVNYINLSTAKSIRRAKETGLRKVVGASRAQLVKLYITESFVLTTISVFLAFAIAERALPYYGRLVERELSLIYGGAEFIFTIIIINIVVSFIAGAYPAFKLSSYEPVEAIRGSKSPKGKKSLRRSLVLFQFLVAQLLIIATIVIQSQLQYLQNKDLGYNREQALYINAHGELKEEINVFKDKIRALPNVQSLAASDGVFTWSMISFFDLSSVEGNEDIEEDQMVVADVFVGEPEFVDVLEIEIVEGRRFDPDNTSDLKEGILINETAVKRFGWSDNPIGRKIDSWGGKYVIGVMKDFHNESLRAEIKPAFILVNQNAHQFVNLRLTGTDIPETIDQIEEAWNEMVEGRPLEYTFYDDKFDQHYKGEMRLGEIFTAFASLAIGISLLGLVGLTAFTAEQRLKEIGIRKVLGATIGQVMSLLSKEFIVLSLIAFVMAIPITFYSMNQWLSAFKYRIDIGLMVYMIAILASIGVAWLVVSLQAIKVARSNPVNVLRTE